MDFEVLIIGSDVNAYYLARCYHEAYNKKAYMLIKEKLAYTEHSKIINRIYNSEIWNESKFVIAINTFLKNHSNSKVVVISSNETYAEFLVKNKDKFLDNILFNYPELSVINNLINKENFYKNYKNMGLIFPKTIYYKCGTKFMLDKDFKYPVIIKPANVVQYNHVTFNGKKKIYKLNTKAEVENVIKLINKSDYEDVLIVQEYIPGDDSYLFDSVVYCDKESNVRLISLAQIGLQEHNPNMVGNAAVVINGYSTFDIDTKEIVSSIKSFMEKISFRGFAEFDMKYDSRDHKMKVLEINARQGRCSYYIDPAGYNLVKILVDDLVFNKNINYRFVNDKVMLSFVNKSIIKTQIVNDKFKREALRMYKKSCNPIKYKKDKSLMRTLLYFKRDRNYKKSYSDYKW